jgi:hypothetical protein
MRICGARVPVRHAKNALARTLNTFCICSYTQYIYIHTSHRVRDSSSTSYIGSTMYTRQAYTLQCTWSWCTVGRTVHALQCKTRKRKAKLTVNLSAYSWFVQR